jgi:hypothetical protein
MFKFLFKYLSNSDISTSTTTGSSSSRKIPFDIHYRTAYKKCWIDKIKNR